MTKYLIDLKQTPNQEFFINLENKDMTIRIVSRKIPLLSVFYNNKYIVQNVPCFPNQEILPYPYQSSEIGGNFYFESADDEYPEWKNFGTTCKFYFVSGGKS